MLMLLMESMRRGIPRMVFTRKDRTRMLRAGCVRKDRMRTPRVVFMRDSYAGSAA